MGVDTKLTYGILDLFSIRRHLFEFSPGAPKAFPHKTTLSLVTLPSLAFGMRWQQAGHKIVL